MGSIGYGLDDFSARVEHHFLESTGCVTNASFKSGWLSPDDIVGGVVGDLCTVDSDLLNNMVIHWRARARCDCSTHGYSGRIKRGDHVMYR